MRPILLPVIIISLPLSIALQGLPAQTHRDLARFAVYTTAADEGDYMIAPPYENAPEISPREGVPKGTLYRFTRSSSESRIYPGIYPDHPAENGNYVRNVKVYIPAHAIPGKPLPFLVSQECLGEFVLPNILDNMIADGRLPPIAAIMIDPSSRRFEQLPMNGDYAEFVETEVLPRVEKISGATFSRDPDARMAMGTLLGGVCSFTMAWYRPDLYRRVLSYSGAFVREVVPHTFVPWPLGMAEYHNSLIPNSPRKPIKVWLFAGENDVHYSGDDENGSVLLANDKMAGELKAKGYSYQYVYAGKSMNPNFTVINQTLPQALEWIWKDFPR